MASTQNHIENVQAKIDKLRHIKPYLIDSSLRENPVGAGVGQTLADKLSIFPKLRAFGFKHILLGSLDYAMPDELEVDDDFMRHLRDHKIDMTGCFAATDMGIVHDDGTFTPSPSQLKLKDYGVPNTLHEIYLSQYGMAGQYDLATLQRSLPASIAWLNDNIIGDNGTKPCIIINIIDGCDAFAENTDNTCEILSLLAQQAIAGVSIEDDRGTYMPFQVGAYTALARSCLPAPLKLLVHIHAGAGFENASVIEALLNGADGAWGGLAKRAAIIGHASLGELIANLLRVGNPHMHDYQLNQLLPLATYLQTLDDETSSVPDDYPILGNNAYRLSLSFFRQIKERWMDLEPEAIGGQYRYRICPLVSDAAVIAGRLAELTNQPAQAFSADTLTQMIRLMRRDLRAGKRIFYDEPEQLLALLARTRIE